MEKLEAQHPTIPSVCWWESQGGGYTLSLGKPGAASGSVGAGTGPAAGDLKVVQTVAGRRTVVK